MLIFFYRHRQTPPPFPRKKMDPHTKVKSEATSSRHSPGVPIAPSRIPRPVASNDHPPLRATAPRDASTSSVPVASGLGAKQTPEESARRLIRGEILKLVKEEDSALSGYIRKRVQDELAQFIKERAAGMFREIVRAHVDAISEKETQLLVEQVRLAVRAELAGQPDVAPARSTGTGGVTKKTNGTGGGSRTRKRTDSSDVAQPPRARRTGPPPKGGAPSGRTGDAAAAAKQVAPASGSKRASTKSTPMPAAEAEDDDIFAGDLDQVSDDEDDDDDEEEGVSEDDDEDNDATMYNSRQ